jgi:preprotein translocase subunit YajC
MIESLKEGDEIITDSGIYGKIIKINPDDLIVDVEISKNNIVKLTKTSIATKLDVNLDKNSKITDHESKKSKIDKNVKNSDENHDDKQ